MKLFKEKYTSPFDMNTDRKQYNAAPKASHIRPSKYLSTRAALFMGLTILSLNFGMNIEDNSWFVLASISLFFLLWVCSFRYITKKFIAPIMCYVYLLIFGGVQYFFSEIVSFKYIFAVLPFCLGLMTLSAMNKDNSAEYKRAESINECALPMVYSVAASLLGFYVNSFFEVRFSFVANIISVVFLMIASWALTKGSGSSYYFTSKRLSELWDIPVSDVRNVKLFAKSRLLSVASMALATIIIFTINIFIPDNYLHISRIIAMPLVSAIMLIFVYIGYKTSEDVHSLFGIRLFVYESFLAAAFITAPFIYTDKPDIKDVVIFYFLAVFIDVLVTAVLAVIRRQQIFVNKSKYIDGLPFMLVFLSIFIMLIECCLYQANPL